MQIGDIILIPFPFAELTGKKLRPAVVLAQTNRLNMNRNTDDADVTDDHR